ncbi:MAG: AAA family ATPase, partial [Pirellulales bacterium]|nr:AAA family ATPase [Pirellulales bacterium]
MTKDSFSTNRARELYDQLCRLVAERAAVEKNIPLRRDQESETEAKEYQASKEEALESYRDEKSRAESDYSRTSQSILEEFQSAQNSLRSAHEHFREERTVHYTEAQRVENQKLRDAQWEANTIFEATKDGPAQRFEVTKKQILSHRARIESLHEAAKQTLKRRHQWRETYASKSTSEDKEKELSSAESVFAQTPSEASEVPSMQRFIDLVTEADRQWHALATQQIAALFEGSSPLGLLVIFAFAIFPITILLLDWTNFYYWIPVGSVVTLGAWAVACVWLFRIARRQSSRAYKALRETVDEAEAAAIGLLKAAEVTRQCEEAAIAARLKSELERAENAAQKALAEINARKTAEFGQAERELPVKLAETVASRDEAIAELEEESSQRFDEIDRRFRHEANLLAAEHTRKTDELKQRYDQAWNEMADRWRTGITEFETSLKQLNESVKRRFPDWDSSDWKDWEPAADTPDAMPFGHVDVDMSLMKGGPSVDDNPGDKRLVVEQTRFELPALVPFPDKPLIFTVEEAGRVTAARTLGAVMLRMLTASRPGKIRFTIIDPVGLGEDFSAFMHLADFDERLVTNRIWTESAHIDQRLVDLTEHMENVIQVYLRNEFNTIHDYNKFAGEMAEPYRVLVVANFPANFTESAARRLMSIISSGARCGVHTLMTVDPLAKMPHGFRLEDLEAQGVHLVWLDGRYVWKDSGLEDVPLRLETSPEASRVTEIIRRVGEKLGDVDRVEVPFEFVVPKEEDWWTADAAGGIDVPLGRAGAMKLQHLALGRGTAQHVLVSGKTGSGKSNLLHAIITNVALWYGPEEVELYLVDFKKGVEFKAYSQNELPHARVIAIESEREFGQSVLESLDAELKRRGDIFRELGVQNLTAYRKARPDEVMPRVLLVIDEFQELFVEDDRIAQNAALLLDRLVRQGRAFGMHVLLGSQTLAGSYSLPRATIGQMAVRIALQCSEADAHLILSEENTAARLLTRPGEAIYNDANGLYEGNHPFQVVWLPDNEQEAFLTRVQKLANDRNYQSSPPIVFEGNAAADPRDNRMLEEMLTADSAAAAGPSLKAWLGAAVAIKDPTAATFHRQGGSNLVLVGHREEEAIGIMTTAMISLAAQIPANGAGSPAPTTFYVLDGTHPEATEAVIWPRVSGALPHGVKLCQPRKAGDELAEIAAELKE